MLELVAIYLLSQRLSRMAMVKGLSRSWGNMALLWILGEFMFAFALGVAGYDGAMVYPAAIAGAAVGATVAWAVVRGLAPAPGWTDGMRWAGWCRKCKANVWLTEDATKCQNGHSVAHVGKLYVPARGESAEADLRAV